MEWKFIIALIFAIPVILFPVAFLWYINAGRLIAILSQARRRKSAGAGQPHTVVVPKHRQTHTLSEAARTAHHMR